MQPKQARPLTVEQCAASFAAGGRQSCGGCSRERDCPLAQATSRWLVDELLPKIDPGRHIVIVRLG